MDLEQLQSTFQTDYKPKLQEIDHKRKRALWVIGIGIIVIPLITLASLKIISINHMDPQYALFAAVVAFFVFGGIYQMYWGPYRREYKAHVVGTIVSTMYPSLTYQQARCISSTRYKTSELYTKKYDSYVGEDKVAGKIGNTSIEFSELHTSYKTTTTDSKGNSKTNWHTIFQGVFFVADFNKHFNGKLFIVPDGQGLFSSVSKFFTERFGVMGKRISLENPVFEDLFEVYGSDEIEARYILSPKLMERLVSFRTQHSNEIRISFIDECMFIAIPSSRNHFEPKLFQSAASFSVVKGIYDDLKFLTDIVEELDLNTRIWTKY